MALGETSMSGGMILSMRPIVASASSSLDWPGCCFAPAVMTTTSESAHTSTSEDPTTLASGMNWIPCARSSASASTLAVLMS